MPPKARFSKEQMLDAAFKLVRKEGISYLTARSLASTLGCSTQPIYRVYGSIDAVKEDIYNHAAAIALEFLMGNSEDPPFLSIGYGFLRFAQQEPHLYHLLMQSPSALETMLSGETPEIIFEQIRLIPIMAALSKEQLNRINLLMWFFIKGVATLFNTDSDKDQMQLAKELLRMAGEAIIAWETKEDTNR